MHTKSTDNHPTETLDFNDTEAKPKYRVCCLKEFSANRAEVYRQTNLGLVRNPGGGLPCSRGAVAIANTSQLESGHERLCKLPIRLGNNYGNANN